MLFVQIPAAACAPLEAHLHAHGILAQIGPTTRLVTHLDVSAADVETVLAACRSFFDGAGAGHRRDAAAASTAPRYA
jgi:threonine aldolase